MVEPLSPRILQSLRSLATVLLVAGVIGLVSPGLAASGLPHGALLLGGSLLLAYFTGRAGRRGMSTAFAVAGLLAAAAVVMVAARSSPVARRANIAKAQHDTRVIARAVSEYVAYTGRLPDALEQLTRPAANTAGVTRGPLLSSLPTTPAGWTAYRYARKPDGTVRVCASGDGTVAASDGGSECP